MGGFWSKDDLSADFVQELMDETGFNQKQIHRLYIRFRHLDKDKKGYLTKEDLLRLPQVNIIIFYKKLGTIIHFIFNILVTLLIWVYLSINM